MRKSHRFSPSCAPNVSSRCTVMARLNGLHQGGFRSSKLGQAECLPATEPELKVYGLAADIAMARMWYEKAKEFGSAEAPRRLDILASGAR
jgi:hypothetical protein